GSRAAVAAARAAAPPRDGYSPKTPRSRQRRERHRGQPDARLSLRFTSHVTAGSAVIAGFDQLNVKAWLMRRIQIALILRCFRPCRAAASSNAEHRHPLGLRIDNEGGGREGDAVGHAAIGTVQS